MLIKPDPLLNGETSSNASVPVLSIRVDINSEVKHATNRHTPNQIKGLILGFSYVVVNLRCFYYPRSDVAFYFSVTVDIPSSG